MSITCIYETAIIITKTSKAYGCSKIDKIEDNWDHCCSIELFVMRFTRRSGMLTPAVFCLSRALQQFSSRNMEICVNQRSVLAISTKIPPAMILACIYMTRKRYWRPCYCSVSHSMKES